MDVEKELLAVRAAIKAVPPKVRKAINSGTVIDIGKTGASQYDYKNDILYVARGETAEGVIHEIGHVVENKLADSQKVLNIKQKILKDVMPQNFTIETYYDAADNPVEIHLIKDARFVSEYQGCVYINDWTELLDENMNVRSELLAEFISEPFREYIQNPERLKKEFSEFYELVKEIVE